MSHKATSWLSEVGPERMSNAEFRVMFHLCDCHNPSQGCYPSQSYLRDATGLSNGGLNKALSNLEQNGLIKRNRQVEEKTQRRQSTRYILGFEFNGAQEPTPLSGEGSKGEQIAVPTPLSGEGAISTLSADPSPLRAQSHLHPSGDKPVIEPVREPCVSQDATHTQDFDMENDHGIPCSKSGHGDVGQCDEQSRSEMDSVAKSDTAFDFESFCENFLSAYPRIGNLARTQKELRKAIEAGVFPEHILAGAKAYADEQSGNKRQFISMSENWLKDRRWETFETNVTQRGDPKEAAKAAEENAVRAVKSGIHAMCQKISTAQALAMIRAELITVEEARRVDLVTMKDCRNAGVIA